MDAKTKKERQDLLLIATRSPIVQDTNAFLYQDAFIETPNSDPLSVLEQTESHETEGQKQDLLYEKLPFDPLSLDQRAFSETTPYQNLNDYSKYINYFQPKTLEHALTFSLQNCPEPLVQMNKDDLVLQEDSSESKKTRNKVNSIPIEPLGRRLPITLTDRDIIRYLKDNEDIISEENKRLDPYSQKHSIIRVISKTTGIHEKTLKRIATKGPQRKIGIFFFKFISKKDRWGKEKDGFSNGKRVNTLYNRT